MTQKKRQNVILKTVMEYLIHLIVLDKKCEKGNFVRIKKEKSICANNKTAQKSYLHGTLEDKTLFDALI